MADSDMIKLYSGRILELAANMPHTAPLADPEASARKRSPLCGSTVSVQLCTEDGRISAFSQDVKACALGQAAASVVGSQIIGRSLAEVEQARDQLKAMLKSGGPAPDAPFDGLSVLEPAKDYKNRHASIMLALEATLEAMQTAQNA
ncbi:iron-sulfur cluster assembly scaffold protein [Oceaniglobus trochenteri]|uniref:iron-sulfur cluster assembly scaffold protein n=1 Tax=Oceaniglobus trochenteri TaxID=2763260 RepID=UPI001CFF64FA|nr:iron-sulfur cluster assembly scaffold protein [Oceaniglobus trochenteri]